jgi:branched-chain amino acid transport system permease protein
MTLSATPPAAASSTVIERGSVPHRIWQGTGLAVVVLAVVLFPVFSGDFRVTQLGQAVAYAVALLGLNVVTGMSRQISLGHGAMFGIGAYSTAILVSDHGWSFFAALLMSALIGVVVGLVIGLPALRLKGLYLAIVTIAVGTAFPLLLLQPFARDLGSGGSSGKPMFLPW